MSKRILFVDDETNILDGLRRMLRPLRQEWEMRFASSGEEALGLLDQEPCDVLVTDMRMPGMSGVQLLEETLTRCPEAIRIVLSGQSDRESAIAAVGPAHQYLNKPCDAETLKSTIERAFVLRERISNTTVASLVAGSGTLPSAPQSYLDLKKELESDDGSITAVAEIVGSDPALTARVLQVVNSAFFGMRREVANPLEAVRQLGFDLVGSLALSAGIFGQLADPRFERFAGALWRHSLTTATFAKTIARAEGAKADVVNATMTAGLLHDVGKLVLCSGRGDDYLELTQSAKNGSEPLWQLEQEALGTSHAEVGAYLLGLWALPDAIVEVVAYHHSPQQAAAGDGLLLTAVHVANGFAHQGADDRAARVDQEHLEQCGLEDRYEEWEQTCLRSDEERPSA